MIELWTLEVEDGVVLIRTLLGTMLISATVGLLLGSNAVVRCMVHFRATRNHHGFTALDRPLQGTVYRTVSLPRLCADLRRVRRSRVAAKRGAQFISKRFMHWLFTAAASSWLGILGMNGLPLSGPQSAQPLPVGG